MNEDRGRLAMFAMLAVAAVLMVVFPARVLECDAVIYASAGIHRDVVQSTDAGHLVWGGIEVAAAAWGRTFSPPLNPLFILRWLAVASSLAGIWLLYLLLSRRLGLPRLESALIAGALLYSYSYWHFGLQGEPHAPHTLSLVIFLGAAWSLLARPSRGGAIRTGAALGAATLFHQTSILLVPAVVAAIVCASAAANPSAAADPSAAANRRVAGGRRPTAWFLLSYAVVVGIPYLAIGWFVRDLRTIADFRSWLMGISEWGSWGNWRWTSPFATLVGIVRSWTGSHYLLGVEPVRELAFRLFPGASWDDELLLAGAVANGLRLVLLPIQVAVLAGTAWVVIRAATGLRAAWRRAPAFGLLLALWLIVHTVFFTWWAPERAEFWIAFWLPLLVLLAPGFGKARVRASWLAAGVLALAVINFAGSIVPQSSARLEPATLAAVAIDPVVKAGDVLLTDLPLSRRAGRFVYLLDVVAMPGDPGRAAGVVDSLLTVAAMRGNALYWVGGVDTPPSILNDQFHIGPPIPVRAPVGMRPLHR